MIVCLLDKKIIEINTMSLIVSDSNLHVQQNIGSILILGGTSHR